MRKGKEVIALELVGWMLSGQEGSMTYVCMSSKDAKEIYNHAVDILKGILLKIRWEDKGILLKLGWEDTDENTN